MRRTDREITDREEIDGIIRECDVCRLALAADNEPYLVPVCFGYDGSALYLHTAPEGKKIRYFEANKRVCFEFERNIEIIPNDSIACKWSLVYESVIGYGSIEALIETEEREYGLNQIMLHYSGKEWDFKNNALGDFKVWKISIDSLTGKKFDGKTV